MYFQIPLVDFILSISESTINMGRPTYARKPALKSDLNGNLSRSMKKEVRDVKTEVIAKKSFSGRDGDTKLRFGRSSSG